MIRSILQAIWRFRVRRNQPDAIAALRDKYEAARKAHKPRNHILRQMQEIRHSRLGKV